MKKRKFVGMLLALLGCKPEVGDPVSLIRGPSILAVRGEPAEADPRRDQTVTYEVLAVDVEGRIPAPDSTVNRPALWAICSTPKPPVEANAVSSDCVDGEKLPGQYGFSLTGFSSKMPFDACSLFGPNPPPAKEDEAQIRPRDPDVTGGYYLPIRVSLWIPEGQRRKGMAGQDTLVAFGFERISCGLANVDSKTARQFEETYTLNKNPRLSGLRVTSPTVAEVRAGTVFHVPRNASVTFEASWHQESVESFPVYDIESRTLQTRRESMVVAWYATGGTFEHDSSGRGETEIETVTSNQWTAGDPGDVHMWLVLRDNRGGVDFAAYDLVVDP